MWHTCVQDLVGKSEGNSLFARPKHRCVDIKMDFRETVGEGGLRSSGSGQGQVSGESWYPMQHHIILLHLTSGSGLATGTTADPSTNGSEPPCPVECGKVLD